MSWVIALVVLGLAAVVVYDLVQRKHAILRNFPIIGHLRYMLEAFGPELRQYIVTSNDEERPFSRDQRRWVYASAKRQNNYFGFGTDNEMEGAPNYLIVKHTTFPYQPPPQVNHGPAMHPIPCAKVLGRARGRARAFRPASIVNISAMSYGSLSGSAIEALNRGAALADCLHNTGEGGISPYHNHGAGLIWQIGTGYFGCRSPEGAFDPQRFLEQCERHDVRMIEIKLSQGAKPGKGGVLPAEKVSPQIAAIRGIPVGRSCISPSGHSAFSCADSLLDFVERIASETGLPVGIKSAVGELDFFVELAELMEDDDRGVDFITIDGGEGGTGAAPLVFADHVALPFNIGMTRVYRLFVERGLQDDVVFIGSGKLGFPERGTLAMALGCDMIAVAREAMMAIGCIQAQKCHTGRCPAGVATQHWWYERGLDPHLKSVRFANYLATLRHDLLGLAHACGQAHPAAVSLGHFEILDDRFGGRSAQEVFAYQPGWGLPPADQLAGAVEAMEAQ